MSQRRRAVAAIVGSAFPSEAPGGLQLVQRRVVTPWGPVDVHQVVDAPQPAYLLFRHGLPHRLLPNQIPYRAHAWALRDVGCGALLVTSSVGVLDPQVPLFEPLLVGDLLMPENRLPDGSACTMFTEPAADQGHLVLNDGLFSSAMSAQLRTLAGEVGLAMADDPVVFAYAGGPRTKTPAENRWWAQLGAQVNSMTLAPEVVLANELEIPCAGVVVGHKYSVPGIDNPDEASVAGSLARAREATEHLVVAFLRHARPVPFANHVFRFGEAAP